MRKESMGLKVLIMFILLASQDIYPGPKRIHGLKIKTEFIDPRSKNDCEIPYLGEHEDFLQRQNLNNRTTLAGGSQNKGIEVYEKPGKPQSKVILKWLTATQMADEIEKACQFLKFVSIRGGDSLNKKFVKLIGFTRSNEDTWIFVKKFVDGISLDKLKVTNTQKYAEGKRFVEEIKKLLEFEITNLDLNDSNIIYQPGKDLFIIIDY